jgi:hypothetical protein
MWATKTCRDANHLYHLKTHEPYGFCTGKCGDEQLIIGVLGRDLLRLTFDCDGDYKRTKKTKLPSKIDKNLRQRFPDKEDPELAALLEDEQIEDCDIDVRRFFDAENDVGIKDLPGTYAQYLDGEARYLAGETEETREQEKAWIESEIEQWKLRGDYVFYWINDFFVNKLGEVVSS